MSIFANFLHPPLSIRGLDPETVSYVAAIESADGQSLEPEIVIAINDFIKGCKNDDIWDAIKASCILAGARTLNGALVPLKGNPPINTNGNFVASDYNRATGLQSSGGDTSTAKRLNPQRQSSDDPQDNVSLCVWVTDSSNLQNLDILIGAGSGTSAGTTHMRAASTTGTIQFRNRAGGGPTTSGQWIGTGFLGTSRSSSSQVSIRFNSTSSVHSSTSSQPFASHQVFATSQTTATALNASSNVRLAFYSIGEALDLEKLDTRITRLIEEIAYFINTGFSGSSYDIDTLKYINAGYAAGGALS
jgi:hypothetical protein